MMIIFGAHFVNIFGNDRPLCHTPLCPAGGADALTAGSPAVNEETKSKHVTSVNTGHLQCGSSLPGIFC